MIAKVSSDFLKFYELNLSVNANLHVVNQICLHG